jgi:membrane protein implicated in regulation of membrane protease activity
MYLIVIGWIYVVLMMSIAEATNTTGTLLGASITFVLYGVLPVALVVYLMGAPARSKAIKKRNAEERAKAVLDAHQVTAEKSVQPDAGGHAAGGSEP